MNTQVKGGGEKLATCIETYTEKFKDSAEYLAESSKYIPAGFSRGSVSIGPHPLVAERGEGPYLYTVGGHKLLDLNNNFTVNVHGHNHPKILEAAEDVLRNAVYSIGTTTKYESKLAALLCERVESFEKVVFSCSASEACLSAIRIARGFTGKDRIAKLEGGYHGSGDVTAWSTHIDPLQSGFPIHPKPVVDTMGVPEVLRGHTVVMPQNDLKVCERMIRENAADLAAVIFELQSGAGGLIPLDKEFVQGIRAITRELGILLIFDETINMRYAPGGMQSAYGVKPDLTATGKVVGGGFPMGAVGGREEVMQVIRTEKVWCSGTHHGHAVCCAAGVASLEMLDQSACDKINGFGDRIKSELNHFVREKNYPVNVAGMGDHIGIETLDQPGRNVRSCRDLQEFCDDIARQVFNFELINRGYFPTWTRGQICTSSVMTAEDIEGFITTCKEIMEWMYGS
jgi:glutamate-1-semialdehyde 2,1-aminomutase